MSEQTGAFTTIPLAQFVTSAKFQLFGSTEASDADMWFATLANEAIRHIDNINLFVKKQCVLEIEDKKAKLPTGFYRLIAARFCVEQQLAPLAYNNLIYVDTPFLESCGADCATWQDVYPYHQSLQIQDGWVYVHAFPKFILDADGLLVEAPDEIKRLNISYLGLNMDENGLFKGYEDYERGIRAYICWKYCLQNMDIQKYAMQKNDHFEEWKAQKKWVKAKDFQNDFRNTRRQVMQYANALIVDKANWGKI